MTEHKTGHKTENDKKLDSNGGNECFKVFIWVLTTLTLIGSLAYVNFLQFQKISRLENRLLELEQEGHFHTVSLCTIWFYNNTYCFPCPDMPPIDRSGSYSFWPVHLPVCPSVCPFVCPQHVYIDHIF